MGGARSGLEELEGHAHKLHPEQEPRPHVHSYWLEGEGPVNIAIKSKLHVAIQTQIICMAVQRYQTYSYGTSHYQRLIVHTHIVS